MLFLSKEQDDLFKTVYDSLQIKKISIFLNGLNPTNSGVNSWALNRAFKINLKDSLRP